jgi:hypothetical protein
MGRVAEIPCRDGNQVTRPIYCEAHLAAQDREVKRDTARRSLTAPRILNVDHYSAFNQRFRRTLLLPLTRLNYFDASRSRAAIRLES